MSENETSHGGSRWEPGGTSQPDDLLGGSTPQPEAARSWPPPAVPQPAATFAGRTAPAEPARAVRGRLAMAAAAVGLVAAGGIGGFVVGQASAGNAGEPGVVQNGVPGGGNGEGGFPGQFRGGSRPDLGSYHAVPLAGDGTQTAPGGTGTGTDGSADQGTG